MQEIFPFRQAADLVFIRERFGSFIGSRTYGWKSWDAFMRLVWRYSSWDAVADDIFELLGK